MQRSLNSSRLYAIPPPTPPKVKAGLMINGYEFICLDTSLASNKSEAIPEGHTFTFIFSIDSLNSFLSSALLIAFKSAPINSTLLFVKKSDSESFTARFKAV